MLVNAISWKPLVRLTSYFEMALILLRPRTLLIKGILRKPGWPPQQFEDLHCILYRIFLVNAISWKPLVRLTSHFDMALISLRPRTLLIWGILRKPRWQPQQFEDLHGTLYRILLVNTISWKQHVRLSSHFDMALISLRPWILLIWGILQKPRWPPQQFEDKHFNHYRILIATSE